MTFLEPQAPLRLKVDGFRTPLRLRSLRRVGALETFAVEGEMVQAVRLAPIPEAAGAYAAALDAFEALGQRLQAATPRSALPIEAVVRATSGVFWLQPPPGRTLEAWLAEHPGRVAEPVVAALARRLAEALTELHAAGIVHGDISPRAVLIDGNTVRLTGFMVDRRPFFRALRSQDGLVEPGYAPPEAHDGALRHPIGPAADLYAASALLQRLLVGRAPPPANQATRVTGDNAWPADIAVPSSLRAGIEAGLAPALEARPTSAAAWLSGLALGPETDAWFDELADMPPPTSSDSLDLPPLPTALEPLSEPEPAEAPLTLVRDAPKRRRVGWWLGGAVLAAVAIAAVALVASKLTQSSRAPSLAIAPKAAPPPAPSGCQWISASDGWRLRCTDAPAQGLRLPERFDAQTTARAATGEPTAMERLGAFYRLRAGETANPNRGTYAYQALDWLQRAADAPAPVPTGARPDTARARDDAALALGQMLARGEGGRAPDPNAAETRLRQAAEGSRADAVLALGQFLEAQAGDDADRLAEARGLYTRVAQLGDGSTLEREAERGLARIDAATKPPPPLEVPPAPRPAVEKPVAEKPAPKPAPEPKAKASAQKVAQKAAQPQPAPTKTVPPVVRAPPKPVPAPPRRPVATVPTPVMRTWTASTFIRVDPTTNFTPSLELAGRAACDSEGGETIAVRAGDTICPNGVNYCQVRAVATCQGARP